MHMWICIVGLMPLCRLVQTGPIPPLGEEELEYCQWDTFNATCRQDEVILMRSAHYGRMKLGRCLKADYFVGCSKDVLSHVDTRCSGRQTCVLNMPDPKLFNVQPCRKDLVAYFSASYDCVTVLVGNPDSCSTRKATSVPPSGFIANYLTEENGFGASHCPWRIAVSPGQQINVTMYDFFTWDENDNFPEGHLRADACTTVGLIREGKRVKEIQTCLTHQYRRMTHIYTATSNNIEIELVHPATMKKRMYILLKYEAIGCANLRPPANAWMLRTADVAVVRCNQTSRTWHLVCRGTTWMGDIGNCTTDTDPKWKLGQVLEISGRFPYGILIAIGIGVILGIFLGVSFLLVVLACHKKRRGRAVKTRETNALLNEDPAIYSDHGEVAYKLMEIRDTARGPSSGLHLREEPCCVSGVTTLRRHQGEHVYESPRVAPGEMTLSGDMTLTLKVKDRQKGTMNYPAGRDTLNTVDLIRQEPKTATLKRVYNPRDLSALDCPPGDLVR